jgi:hypothetical protein
VKSTKYQNYNKYSIDEVMAARALDDDAKGAYGIRVTPGLG